MNDNVYYFVNKKRNIYTHTYIKDIVPLFNIKLF